LCYFILFDVSREAVPLQTLALFLNVQVSL
jgi:hypothetical protein